MRLSAHRVCVLTGLVGGLLLTMSSCGKNALTKAPKATAGDSADDLASTGSNTETNTQTPTNVAKASPSPSPSAVGTDTAETTATDTGTGTGTATGTGGDVTATIPTPLPPPPRCPGADGSEVQTNDSWVGAVTWPQERMVFQRDPSNTGTVHVSVIATPNTTCLEVSTILTGAHGKAQGWQMLDNMKITPAANNTVQIDGTFRQHAGGWYQLFFITWSTAHAYSNPVSPHMVHINRVGVGEVFVVAGQSNSTNCGDAAMTVYTPDDRVSATSNYGSLWAYGQPPMAGPADGCVGGTPWAWLGTDLVNEQQVPVAFSLVGWGGTQTAQWLPNAGAGTNCAATFNPVAGCQPASLPNGALFNRLRDTVASLNGLTGLRAVLWHQGESDAATLTSTATYIANMRAIIGGVRAASNTTHPWLVAHASWLPGYTVQQQAAQLTVTAAQDWLGADHNEAVYAGPNTDLLTACTPALASGAEDLGTGFRDCLHNNSPHMSYHGLAAHGDAWDVALHLAFTFPGAP